MDKHLNEAFVGNKKIRVSFNDKGKILRLFYPSPDYRQFFEFSDTLFKVDEKVFNIHTDLGNEYNQYYVKNTNILKTEIINKEIGIKIIQTDFCPPDEDILIRKYIVENLDNVEKDLSPIIHARAISNFNNEVSGYIKHDALIQFTHDFSSAIFSKLNLETYKINNNEQRMDIESFDTKDYIGLSNTSTIVFKKQKLKTINDSKRNKKLEFDIIYYFNNNKQQSMLNQMDTEIIRLKKINTKDKENKTKKYYEKYVKSHITHDITKLSEEIQQIYIRSILLFDLMYNHKTGGFSVAFEVDEEKRHCGRYSFSWPRDSYFAFKGFMLLNFEEQIRKYYEEFLKRVQNRSGRWEQRFFTDGTLAPSWGYQIDETALSIIGIHDLYKKIKDKSFLKNNIIMIDRACRYLIRYTDDLLSGKDTNTFDLWENFRGDTIFGTSALFESLYISLKIYSEVESEYKSNRLKLEQIKKQKTKIEERLPKLKNYIIKTFYDSDRKSFVRAKKERTLDASSIVSFSMFNVFSPKELKSRKTIENIDMSLRTYSGGYLRFEDDHYIGGDNPWPMVSLWMTLYYIKIKDKEKALENFDFVTKTVSKHGFLAEQICNEMLCPKWVIGLSWMHGLYIYVLDKLIKNNML